MSNHKTVPYICLALLVAASVLLLGAAPFSPAREKNAATAGAAQIERGLAPHKALYDIQMVSRHSGSPILNISGQMFYEWQRGCDAWTTDHRFRLFYEYADSPPMRITSDFSTYETFDGKSFNFSSRRMRNGELFEELRGQALREDNQFAAAFTKPEGLEFKLSPDTFFPMAHTIALLEHAKRGEKFYISPIFDGSDDQGPVEVSAFIGKPANALAKIKATAGLDTGLIDTPAWHIRMAFFPIYEPGAESDYEMDVIFHENGLISDMRVDYKDFSVTQKLAALEKLSVESCNNKENSGNRRKK